MYNSPYKSTLGGCPPIPPVMIPMMVKCEYVMVNNAISDAILEGEGCEQMEAKREKSSVQLTFND